MREMSIEQHCNLKGKEFTPAQCMGDNSYSSGSPNCNGEWKCPDTHKLVGRCCEKKENKLEASLGGTKKMFMVGGVLVILGLAYFMYLEQAKA
jgi:hypothetical protein